MSSSSSSSSSDPAERACGAPGCPAAPVLRCARCRRVGYCGPACQRTHWPAHKADCARIAAELAALGSAIVPIKRPGEAAREAARKASAAEREALAAAEWAAIDLMRGSEAALLAYVHARKRPDVEARARALHAQAVAGSAMAQMDVAGIFHAAGKLELTTAWCRRAAEAGHGPAQLNLGKMYRDGIGVPRSSAQAAVWFEQAAAQGSAMATFELGILYRHGEGVECSSDAAAGCFAKAANLGMPEAQRELGRLYAISNLGSSATMACAWYAKAAAQGDSLAQFSLARCHEHGVGVEHDLALAVKWHREAAARGSIDAQFCLGRLLARGGEGVERDLATAAAWLMRAAAGGHVRAAKALRRTQEQQPPAE